MEKFVLEMAQEIRQQIQAERPEIIELRSEIVLRSMALSLHDHKLITWKQKNEMISEIDKLYKKQTV